ncbi:MAG: hypothetical protein ACREBC_15435, partial [Pyrinomonadaceae bacterium]
AGIAEFQGLIPANRYCCGKTSKLARIGTALLTYGKHLGWVHRPTKSGNRRTLRVEPDLAASHFVGMGRAGHWTTGPASA